ncbi:serine/threonine kinase motif-containing protein [Pandoravirus inopinatum]|uniref:Serine/threonine kinase motif-containing protein n=1 Tax=Pandoravirus inopinatum TaxID=1605721 RepID=A0A0B5J8Z5_9VIRU|nr:serine/threonine kinase motif-containing protein [Pandoravirus inopinatum]AJF97271.1 serine/threonine kinase motif-containing protein [Pandoravirus inopinatum]
MVIFDGLPLFAAVWAGTITRWDDPAFGAGSGATPDMLPPGEVLIAVERFPSGSLETEAASLGATFAQALSSASPAFADAYAAHDGDLAALVLATAGTNRTLLVDPVTWSVVVPAGTTPAGPVYDPVTARASLRRPRRLGIGRRRHCVHNRRRPGDGPLHAAHAHQPRRSVLFRLDAFGRARGNGHL